MIKRTYGWIKQKEDKRDFKFVPFLCKLTLDKIDLRTSCPPVYDQGSLGSCTANAVAGAFQFDELKQEASIPSFVPSRLFIYYNERMIENTPPADDSGAEIRDGMKSINSYGVCTETTWSYDAGYQNKPSPAAYTEALLHKSIQYNTVNQDLNSLQVCLASGYPIIFGFNVYPEFESDEAAQTGIVSMPKSNENPIGGHAVLAVGYDNLTQMFVVRNSWGPNWGISGYFMMPYAYITNPNLASDFWELEQIMVE